MHAVYPKTNLIKIWDEMVHFTKPCKAVKHVINGAKNVSAIRDYFQLAYQYLWYIKFWIKNRF